MAETHLPGESLRSRRHARHALRAATQQRQRRQAREAARRAAEAQSPSAPPRRRRRWSILLATALLAAGVYQSGVWRSIAGDGAMAPAAPAATRTLAELSERATLPAGEFTRGAIDGPPETRPARQIALPAIELDKYEVSNGRFAQFVAATGYITTAEQLGKSYVFLPGAQRWELLEGASWRHPHGPGSTITGKERHPVVQVSWYDAVAFADWAQMRLPTEAEWERAARGGRLGWSYPWGNALAPNKQERANAWQGSFPFRDLARDGHPGLAEVGSFPATRYDLYDLCGNVAEWCADWYGEDYYAGSPTYAPTGPASGAERVVRGGSWISTPATGEHLTVFARDHLPPGAANNHTGFRCARTLATD